VLAVGGCWFARHLEQSTARSNTREQLLSCGNTLAAGILLAASLTHMLPDATEALRGVTTFPLAPLLAGSAFCFLVILGEVVGGCMPTREEPHTHTDCVAYQASFAIWPRWELMPPHGCDEVDGSAGGSPDRTPTPARALMCETAPSDMNQVPPDPASWLDPPSGACCGHAHKLNPSVSELPDPMAHVHSCHSHSSCCRVHRHSDAFCSAEPLATPPMRGPLHEHLLRKDASPVDHSHSELIPTCHVATVSPGAITEVRSFLLFFALGFHSVMEGLGLGSAHGGLILPVLLAILAHKGLAAFALGCSLTNSHMPGWKFWAFVLIFAMGTPIGCLCGVLFVQAASAANQNAVIGVCIGLASGTFLQVSSMELLPRVLAEEKHKIPCCFALAVGYGVMSLLAIWC